MSLAVHSGVEGTNPSPSFPVVPFGACGTAARTRVCAITVYHVLQWALHRLEDGKCTILFLPLSLPCKANKNPSLSRFLC